MRSKLINFAIVVLILGLACFKTVAWDSRQSDSQPVQVHSMDVPLELDRKNAVKVTEVLQVENPQGSRSHGIFRTLSVNSRTPELMAEAPHLRVLEASIDGKPRRTNDVKSHFGSQNVTIYLQNSRAWLAPGMHAFRLVCEMTGMIGFGQDEDSILWNVTGSGWERGVLASTCTIVPAEGAPLSREKAYPGFAGSMASPVDFATAERNGRTCFVFTTKHPVLPAQDFTVEAALPRGAMPEPASYRPEEDEAFIMLCAGAFLFTLGYCLSLWRNWGRDPKPCPAMPACEPPLLPDPWGAKGKPLRLSPAETQYLANDCLPCSSGLSALFLSLTARAGADSQAAPRRASAPSASSLPPKRLPSR